MLARYPMADDRNTLRRAELYNRYLAFAKEAELLQLRNEIDAVLGSSGVAGKPIKLDCSKIAKSFNSIFDSVLYLSSKGQLKEWRHTEGKRPKNIINSRFEQLRDVSFTVRENAFDDCEATGFKKYSKTQKVERMLSLVGLMLVCYDKPVSEYTYLAQIKKSSLFSLVDELETSFKVKVLKDNDKLLLVDPGPYLSSDPVSFLKMAFPHGILIRNGVTYQLY